MYEVIRKSEYFRAASCFGKEAQNRSISLHGDDDILIELMIGFLYTGDCDLSSVRPDPHADELKWIRAKNYKPALKAVRGTSAVLASVSQSVTSSAVPDPSESSPAQSTSSQALQQPLGEDILSLVASPVPALQKRKGPGAALYHTPTPRHLLLHLQLWEVADKYLVPSLQAVCASRFEEAALYYSEHAEFIDAIEYVYEDLPEHATALRRAITAVLHHDPALLDDVKVQQLACFTQLFGSLC